MASPADRFSPLQKIAVFLIAIGTDRTREVLGELDLDTIEQINGVLVDLGSVTPQEKAAVMIEFGDLFFKGIPLRSKLPDGASSAAGDAPGSPSRVRPDPRPAAPRPPAERLGGRGQHGPHGPKPQEPAGSANESAAGPADPTSASTAITPEQAAARALQHLKRSVDPGKIDWRQAGYDFGEGFRGRDTDRET